MNLGRHHFINVPKFACTGIDGGSMPNLCPAIPVDVGILGIVLQHEDVAIRSSRRGLD